jgi:hypothetical protein
VSAINTYERATEQLRFVIDDSDEGGTRAEDSHEP